MVVVSFACPSSVCTCRRSGTWAMTRATSAGASTVGTRADPPAAQQFELSEVVARDSVARDVAVEEHQGVQGLVLAGRGEPPARDQVVQEALHVPGAQLHRVPPSPAEVAAEGEEIANPP